MTGPGADPGAETRSDAFTLDERHRGVPPGHGPVASGDVAGQGWHPAGGAMALPLLSLDLAAFARNRAAMMGVVRHFQAAIAPHAKTAMSPALARSLVEAGAWATSVADMRQAGVMLRAGLRRIIIANEIGGAEAAGRLARLLSRFPDAEVHVFIDSVAGVAALQAAWSRQDGLPPLGLLLEVGSGRGGVRTAADAAAVVAGLPMAGGRLYPSGVALYEGTLLRNTEAETAAGLAALFEVAAHAMRLVRAHVGPRPGLLLTAGNSSLFDLAIDASAPILREDGNATLVLRSGSCFFGDHGNTQARLDRLVARRRLNAALPPGDANPFGPALRLWAEVLSHPEETLAVCGFGLRDTSHDQGPPVPLRLWRQGTRVAALEGTATVAKLNDQHAFLAVQPGTGIAVGDVVEFGIRHPCTCIDKHQVLYGVDAEGNVTAAFQTFFG